MEEEPKILYHYTSMANLLKILQGVKETGNLTLRGTHVEYLNDREELLIANKTITKELKLLDIESGNEKSLENISDEFLLSTASLFTSLPFIVSFSVNSDSLPMWNTYADNGQGIAIGISNPRYLEKDFEEISVYKCIYDIQNYIREIRIGLLKSLYDSIIFFDNQHGMNGYPADLSKSLSILKNHSFEYEQEFRLVKSFFGDDFNDQIGFSEKDGLIKPFAKFEFPKSILKEIIIGPCSNFGLSRQSLAMCLYKMGYSNKPDDPYFVEIKKSNVPYRLI